MPTTTRGNRIAAALLALLLAAHANAEEAPAYDRPGLGFAPAVLLAGGVAWEQGLPDWSRAGGNSLYTADALLRVGVGGPFELQFGTSYNRLAAGDSFIHGRGDSSLGVKFAPTAAGRFSWGVLGSVTFTDGAPALRGPERQYLLGAAFNWQASQRDSLGAYIETLHHGASSDHLFAINAGRNVSASISAYVEAAWQHTAGSGRGAMAGAGIAWQAAPRVQLDASFRHRIAGDADAWQAGIGIAIYFGRL